MVNAIAIHIMHLETMDISTLDETIIQSQTIYH